MKTIGIFVCTLFLVSSLDVMAQEYAQDLAGGSDLTVKFENVVADLFIEGHSGNQLTIEATGLKPPPEKAEGLKALKRTGLDNTGLALNIAEYDHVVIISGGSNEQELAYRIKLPEKVNLVVTNNWFFHEKDLEIRSMKGEIEVTRQFGKVGLFDVTGPVVANVSNGELNVTFSEVNQESPMSLISSQSDVDITLPANAKATFNLAAGDGEIYTDLDLEKIVEKKEKVDVGDLKVYSPVEGKFINPEVEVDPNVLLQQYNYTYRFKQGDIYVDTLGIFNKALGNYYLGTALSSVWFGGYDYKGTLNGGGVEITIRTQNGNLYLRKAKR